jgi:dTDP-4-dehydrorhamnose 3,5-epimerase
MSRCDILIEKTKCFEDRGSLYTIYNESDFDIKFVQDKISKSNQGVIRGFHGDCKTSKLISCLHGKIKLVTYSVDTDTKNEYILSGDSKASESVLVPPRTLNAHQCLSNNCIFHYKWSEYYTSPEDQWSVNYNDVDIEPDWCDDFFMIVSERDRLSKSLSELKESI